MAGGEDAIDAAGAAEHVVLTDVDPCGRVVGDETDQAIGEVLLRADLLGEDPRRLARADDDSSGRAAGAGDLVVLGPALDRRVRVVLEVVPSGALETEMSEWLKEHAWKLTPLARADAHQIPPTQFRSMT